MGQIAVLFGGPAPEHDVSILTGLQASAELAKAGRSVIAIYWSKVGTFHLVDAQAEAAAFLEGTPKGARPLVLRAGSDGGFAPTRRLWQSRALALDAVILCTHGGPGEDGSLQGALDVAGVAYTGPSLAGAALGMDKLAFTAVARAAGITTLPRVALTASTTSVEFEPPFIVKPRFGGSSIGIDANVADLATARARLEANLHLAHGAVLEPFRADLTDLQVAVRTYPALELSAIERPLHASSTAEILNYAEKYVPGEGMSGAPRELPAALDDARATEVRAAAEAIAAACQVRGIARIDFLEGEAGLFANEINTIPGSLSRYLFIEPVRSFIELLDDLVSEATAVPTRSYVTTGADGAVLRTAGSIAAKLA